MNEVSSGHTCAHCDAANPPNAGYCSYCGAALGTSGQVPFQRPPGPAYQYHYPSQPVPPPFPNALPAGYQQPYVLPNPNAASGSGDPAPYAQPLPQPFATGAYPGAAPSGAYPSQAPISVNVSPIINVHAPMMPPQPPSVVLINNARPAPEIILRVLWFLFFGLWLGALATVIGWLLCIAVITLPLGVMILNRLPGIMTLRPASSTTQVTYANGVTVINTNVGAVQRPFLVRALYFLLIGWWFSALWLAVAWCLVGLSVVTFGISLAPAFMMFNRVPEVLTLREN